MTRRFFFIFFLAANFNPVFSQSSGKEYKAALDMEFAQGSQIHIDSCTPQIVENLELLCRVWGFLKYYHPAVAAGEYNWDAELFCVIPSVTDAKNTDMQGGASPNTSMYFRGTPPHQNTSVELRVES